jgi:hypothetical protein
MKGAVESLRDTAGPPAVAGGRWFCRIPQSPTPSLFHVSPEWCRDGRQETAG